MKLETTAYMNSFERYVGRPSTSHGNPQNNIPVADQSRCSELSYESDTRREVRSLSHVSTFLIFFFKKYCWNEKFSVLFRVWRDGRRLLYKNFLAITQSLLLLPSNVLANISVDFFLSLNTSKKNKIVMINVKNDNMRIRRWKRDYLLGFRTLQETKTETF